MLIFLFRVLISQRTPYEETVQLSELCCLAAAKTRERRSEYKIYCFTRENKILDSVCQIKQLV